VDYTPGPAAAHIGSSPAWKQRQAELMGLSHPAASAGPGSLRAQPQQQAAAGAALAARPRSAPHGPTPPKLPQPQQQAPPLLDPAALPSLSRNTMPARLLAGADVRNGLRAKLQSNAARLAPDSGDTLEAWVNNVLASSYVPGTRPHGAKAPAAAGAAAAAQAPPPGMGGLAKFGLAPPELARAGLSDPSIRRLYKGLYVYSMGLFDLLQVGGWVAGWLGAGALAAGAHAHRALLPGATHSMASCGS
jgi:hypothetical protein